PTVAALSAYIEQSRGQTQSFPSPPPLLAGSRPDPIPLSFAQQRLWFLHQLDPLSSAYNCGSALHLTGPLDFFALSRALTEIVRRHETLRSHFTLMNGNPAQVVRLAAPVVP